MTLSIGDTLPELDVTHISRGDAQTVNTASLFGAGRSVLFGLPGAFTPTCNDVHVPSFILHAEKIKSLGVDRIICLSVNDPFVMKAWATKLEANSLESDRHLEFIADGSGEFTRAIGLDVDLTAVGFGVRCQRFAALLSGLSVEQIGVEDGRSVSVSGAETVLEWLRS